MDRKEAINILSLRRQNAIGTLGNLPREANYTAKNVLVDEISAYDMAIEALKEPERIIKQLEELRDDPIMHCSEDYWEGHYMAAKEAIAIVRGEEELKQTLAKELGCDPDEITRIIT